MHSFRKHFFNQFDAFQVDNHPLQINGVSDEEISGGAPNPGEVSWIFSAAIKKGEAANLKQLVKEIADATEANEPDTLSYHWYISEDGLHGEVHEHYRNSSAALEHLSTFNTHYADRIMTMVEPDGMIVFGDPSPALRQELAGASPVFMQAVTGFSRG